MQATCCQPLSPAGGSTWPPERTLEPKKPALPPAQAHGPRLGPPAGPPTVLPGWWPRRRSEGEGLPPEAVARPSEGMSLERKPACPCKGPVAGPGGAWRGAGR